MNTGFFGRSAPLRPRQVRVDQICKVHGENPDHGSLAVRIEERRYIDGQETLCCRVFTSSCMDQS
jgi:hypothetical protein